MASHTTTGEWQSFEARMRRRRAERLALRADVAADGGCPEEAEACLEEGRRLAPSLPEFALVEQKLRGGSAVPAAVVSPFRRKNFFARKTLLAAAALGLIAVAATSLGGSSPIKPSRDFRSATKLVDARTAPLIFRLEAEATRPVGAAATESVAEARRSGVASSPPPPVASTRWKSEIPPVASAIKQEPQRRPVSVIALETPASRAEPAAAPAAVPLPETPAVIPAPAPHATVPAEPPAAVLVRSALDRYAAAYSTLDADAAQRAWPGVNRGALMRAFESLESQRVSLGQCRIDVSGASARAICAGSATWAPKIGSGSPRTDQRRWDFELARTDGAWEIVNARVQNR